MNFQEITYGWEMCQGWCSKQKAITLASIVFALRPKLTVEIGVFGGKSFIPMAVAHRQIGFGMVIGIDPWAAVESTKGQVSTADEQWWNDQSMHDRVYADFMQKRADLGLNDNTQIYRASSNDVVAPCGIGLLSIDGNHGDQAIADVLKFCPMVTPGGVVVMDDLHWTGGSIERAVGKLIGLGFNELYRVAEQNEWAVFQRL